MKNAVFWNIKKQIRTQQETHCVSATKTRRLMLCKIWSIQGSDYEQWRLLGYKNPVRNSQKTHYVFATKPSRLMLCKIWGNQGGDYEECRLLGHKSPALTQQATPYFSATESSQLTLSIELFKAVIMKNVVFWDKKPSLYLTENTLLIRYIAQPVNTMSGLKFSRRRLWRMASSRIWRRVAVVITDVSVERIILIIRVKRIIELRTTLAVTSNWSTLRCMDRFNSNH
jgi:hypothetical protein